MYFKLEACGVGSAIKRTLLSRESKQAVGTKIYEVEGRGRKFYWSFQRLCWWFSCGPQTLLFICLVYGVDQTV